MTRSQLVDKAGQLVNTTLNLLAQARAFDTSAHVIYLVWLKGLTAQDHMKCCVPHKNDSSSHPSIACRARLPCSFHLHSSPTFYTTINQTSSDVICTRRLYLADSSNVSFGPVPEAISPTQLQIPISENHTRGHLIKFIREDFMQQSTPKGSDYLGFGKHEAKTYQEVLKMDHEYCRWIDPVEDQRSRWKLKRFSSWLKMQSVFQEPNLENDMIQERMTKRISQLEEEKLFAEMQASKELDKRRNTSAQKIASSITVLEEENLSLKEKSGS